MCPFVSPGVAFLVDCTAILQMPVVLLVGGGVVFLSGLDVVQGQQCGDVRSDGVGYNDTRIRIEPFGMRLSVR